MATENFQITRVAPIYGFFRFLLGSATPGYVARSGIPRSYVISVRVAKGDKKSWEQSAPRGWKGYRERAVSRTWSENSRGGLLDGRHGV